MPWTGTKMNKVDLRKALATAASTSRRSRGAPVEVAGTGGWKAKGYFTDTRFGTFPGVDLIDPWGKTYQTGKSYHALSVLHQAATGLRDYAPERAGGPRRWVVRVSWGHPVGPFSSPEEAEEHMRKNLDGKGTVDVARPDDPPWAQGGKRRHARSSLAKPMRELKALLRR